MEIAAAEIFRAQSLLQKEGYTYSQDKLAKLVNEKASSLVTLLESNQGKPESSEESLSAFATEIDLNHPAWLETKQDSGNAGLNDDEFGLAE